MAVNFFLSRQNICTESLRFRCSEIELLDEYYDNFLIYASLVLQVDNNLIPMTYRTVSWKIH